MRIAVTTIVRGAGLGEPGGWLRVLDLAGLLGPSGAGRPGSGTSRPAAARELARAPVPDAVHRARDPNPRGGSRGGRGLAAAGDRLAFAINDRILVLRPDWSVERVLSHRWLGGIHDIAADAGGLWVACADDDLVVRLDWHGRVRASWHWRTDRAALRALGLRRMPAFDRWADHRDPLGGGLRLDAAHVNGVSRDGGGLLVGLGLVRPQPPLRWPAVRERGLRLARRARIGALADAATAWWRATPLARIGPYADAAAAPGAPWFAADSGEHPDWTSATFALDLDHRGRPVRPRLVARHHAGGRPAHHAIPAPLRGSDLVREQVSDPAREQGSDLACEQASDPARVVVVLHSATGEVVGLDRRTGGIVRSVRLPGAAPFPRGLLVLPDGRLLVGAQGPAALFVVDLERERVVGRIPLPGDRGESPYAIAAVPDGFADPAGRLPATRGAWPIAGADARRG